jgi:hypothetical protein
VTTSRTIALPGAADAATADATTVWCVAAGRLLAFEAAGSLLLDVAAAEGVGTLAAAGGTLAAAQPGVIAWLEPKDGSVRARTPVGGEPEVMTGGGAIWAFDRRAGRAWRLADEGTLAEPVGVPGADRLAPDGGRVWWTSRDDTLLRGGDRPVDLGVGAAERGAIVACSNVIWVSIAGGLLRVGAWAAELAGSTAAPEGPVEWLCCTGGILAGGSGRRGLFCLDPSVDAGVRSLDDVDLGGALSHLVGTDSVVWAFAAGRAEATLVTVRPGG